MMSLPLFPIADQQPPPIRRRPPRNCHGHQRNWKTYIVDKNLEDSWLESLNSLDAFDLISICEGHPASNERHAKSAHVNLRLKPSLLPHAICDFDSKAEEIQTHFFEIFDHDKTRVEIDFRVRLRSSRSLHGFQHDLVVRINTLHQRKETFLDDETRSWFDTTVQQAHSVDAVFHDLF